MIKIKQMTYDPINFYKHFFKFKDAFHSVRKDEITLNKILLIKIMLFKVTYHLLECVYPPNIKG